MNSALEMVAARTATVCVGAVFAAIFYDFLRFHRVRKVKHAERSFVETGSMTAFFVLYYFVIRFELGALAHLNGIFFQVQIWSGVAMILCGACINVLGRIQLGENWSNQIQVRTGHRFITKGMYGYVRHPLYASIISMFYGGAILYSNWMGAVLTSILFIPAMVYRAKQEERILKIEFVEYADYQKDVGMFFPKRRKRYQNARI